MCSGERPIGAAKGKQIDTEALCQPPPPPWGGTVMRRGGVDKGDPGCAPLRAVMAPDQPLEVSSADPLTRARKPHHHRPHREAARARAGVCARDGGRGGGERPGRSYKCSGHGEGHAGRGPGNVPHTERGLGDGVPRRRRVCGTWRARAAASGTGTPAASLTCSLGGLVERAPVVDG